MAVERHTATFKIRKIGPAYGAAFTCSCGHTDGTANRDRAFADRWIRQIHDTHKLMASTKANAVTAHLTW